MYELRKPPREALSRSRTGALRNLLFASALLCMSAAGIAQSPAWDKAVTFQITAPPFKPDGNTWDQPVPVLIGPIMPTAGAPAPDMMLCIVDAAGTDFCIHDTRVNMFGVPLSICQNAYKCTFSNVKVPSKGFYGILLIDLDLLPASQDYMLGAIMRNGGPEDTTKSWPIEKALHALINRWHAVGAPDEFPEADVADCKVDTPCLGSKTGGIPSVAIEVPLVRACGMPIAGTVEFEVGDAPSSVDLHFRATQNECPGTMEYLWQFGDGDTKTTTQPNVEHPYPHQGSYPIRVIPRCVRKTSTCEAEPALTMVNMGQP